MQVEIWVQKSRVPVVLVKHDGGRLEGNIFCTGEERVSDVIGNDKDFLPFETDDGGFRVVTKANLSLVIPLEDSAPAKVSTRLDRIEVEITTIDGQKKHGKVFTAGQQRVVDILNDGGAFFPLETERGELEIVSKSTIDEVIPVETRMAA
jgi:hypothetical protein